MTYLAQAIASIRAREGRDKKDKSAKTPPLGSDGETFGTIVAFVAPSESCGERAAIVNIDGGIPSPWSDAFAQMIEMEIPVGVFPDEWADLCNAAGVLLDRWGSQLAALGWSPGETLGIRPERPGWDSNCLLSALVNGVRVGVASQNAVTLTFPDGSSRAMLRNNKGWLYE
jgi:hypothetical protein